MKIATRPILGASLAPLVAFRFGEQTAELTATQAEDLAQTLHRAATAARYEAGMAEFLAEQGNAQPSIAGALERIRQLIETRRLARN